MPNIIHKLGEFYYKAKQFALLRIWARHQYGDERLLMEISQLTGRDFKMLEKARTALFDSCKSRDANMILRTYDLADGIDAAVKSLDLPALLQEACTLETKLSASRVSLYSMSALRLEYEGGGKGYAQGFEWPNVGSPTRAFSIYMDAPSSVCLFYKGEPNAVASFLPAKHNTLMINQIQGVRPLQREGNMGYVHKGGSRGLAVLDFPKFLVNCSIQIAKTLAFDTVAIRSGQHNTWVVIPENDMKVRFSLEHALDFYDGTARRLGFEQRNDKNWYKRL